MGGAGAPKTKRLSRSTGYSKKARGSRRMLDAIFQLDRLLQSGGSYSLKWLAAELESSPRTVQRYLELLRDRLGQDVVFDRERGGYAYGAGALRVPAAHLSDEELLAIYVAEPVLAQYAGTPLAEDFRQAWARLTGALPESVKSRVGGLRGRVSVPVSKPARRDVEKFRVLFDAVMKDRQVSITYYSAYRSATSNRVVDPYALRAVAGDWYLVGYCHERQVVLPFKVARVWSASMLRTGFERPEAFNVERFFEHSFGIYVLPDGGGNAARDRDAPEPIELRFGPEPAKHVRERVWHPSQEVEEIEGGGLLLRLRVERTPEMERWVRSWGDEVTVLGEKQPGPRKKVDVP